MTDGKARACRVCSLRNSILGKSQNLRKALEVLEDGKQGKLRFRGIKSKQKFKIRLQTMY
jgi:hypothetical protein